VLGGLVSKAHFGGDPNAGWRWAFVVVGALALASAAVTALAAKDSSAPAGWSLDWPGQVTIAIALFALLFAVVQGTHKRMGQHRGRGRLHRRRGVRSWTRER
jgi:hypothetical protein